MASQVSHIVYGKKIFDECKNKNLSWPKFLVGTIFPDIRYLAKIDRDSTHGFNTSKEKIPNNSFEAGMYIHWYVDEKREKILKKKGIYNLELARSRLYSTALKLVEDQVLYDKYHHWEETVKALDTYYEEEYKYVPDKKIVKEWHNLNQKLFRAKPTDETVRWMILRMGFDEDVSAEVLEQMELVRNNRKIITVLSETYKEV
ncbi:MAG: hypothetical protein P8Y17_00665 [Patescibacteria group bacterium]